MNREHHERVAELFQAAADLRPGERERLLHDACAGDDELRREVMDLLERDARPAALDRGLAVPPLSPPPTAAAGSSGLGLLVASSDAGNRAADVAPPPRHIGQYEIVGTLGYGGMGIVYRARQANPSRFVALKVIHAALTTPSLLRRFEFEAQVLGRLGHPGIAQIYEAGSAEVSGQRVPFFAMELVEGRPLTEFAEAAGLDVRARLRLLQMVCDAVQHAHQQGVIHRDLKPGNVLVADPSIPHSAQPKILDFGIARASAPDLRSLTLNTQPGQLVGTLAYMSPEQLAGDPADVDTRSDVYALGAVAFELLAGRPAFDLRNRPITESIDLRRRSDPPALGACDPALRGDLETIVAKAMAREKERRYASAAALADDIERFLRHEPIEARPASLAYQFRLFARRHWVLVASAAAIVLALSGGIVATTWQGVRAMRSETLATQLAAKESAARIAAETEARKANEIKGFLKSMLVTASQSKVRGAEFTVRQALDDAAARLAREFTEFPDVRLELQMTIGEGYRGLGMQHEAAQHLRASLATRETLRGSDDPDLVEPLHALALVLRNLGEYVECERLLRRALAISVATSGSDTRAARAIRSSLGSVRMRLGDTAEAQRLLDESVSVSADDADASEATAALFRQASACRHAQDWTGAEAVYRQILAHLGSEGESESFGAKTSVLGYLGAALHMQKRCAEAVPILEDALQRQRLSLADDAPRLIYFKARLATCLFDVGRGDDARRLAQESSSAIVRPRQRELPMAISACRKLAELFERMQDAAQAETLLRRGLAIAAQLPPDAEALLCALSLAELLTAQQRDAECETLLAGTVFGAEGGVLADHPVTARCRRAWGRVLLRLGRTSDAETQLLAAHTVLSERFGREDRQAQLVVADLAAFYEQVGNPARAAEFRGLLADAGPAEARTRETTE